jgi:hypothetical protein
VALLDQFNLSQNLGFCNRVLAAFVHAAIAVSTEVLNDVQTLTITGGPTGGTFALTWSGQTTATIPWNASAGTVQTALAALSNVGAGNVVCTGGPLPGTAVVVTFTGTLGNTAQVAIAIGTSSLTGGASPAPSIAHTTVGVGYVNHAARQALASKLLVTGTGPSVRDLAIAVADNATVQADFPASQGYTPLAGAIQGATNANPIVVQSNAHGLTNGQSVTISGVVGNTAANGTATVTVTDANHFSIPVTGNGAYASGGTWVLSETQLSGDIQFQTNSVFGSFT